MYDQFGRYIPDGMGGYNPYMTRQQNMPQRQEIVKVHGKFGADAYQMAPNSTALLLDDTDAIVWFKQTDGAGYPQVIPYAITPYQQEPQVSNTEIIDRLKKLEDKIYGKSDNGDA